jgi:hypothetical protein
MKRSLISAIVAMSIMLSACGNTKNIEGVVYDTYGVANESDKRNPDIEYEISVGSIIVAVIFSETVIIPIYVILFDLWQPVRKIDSKRPKGAIN